MTRICATVLLLAGLGMAQGPMPHAGPPADGNEFYAFEHRPMGHFGVWWRNPEIAQKVGVSESQVQQLDQVLQAHRLKTIDLRAALEREEVRMEPIMHAANPDEKQVLAQIDKIAAQRVQMEKANVQTMFALRRVLTPEQWKKLHSLEPFGRGMHRMGGPGGGSGHGPERFGGPGLRGPNEGVPTPPAAPAAPTQE